MTIHDPRYPKPLPETAMNARTLRRHAQLLKSEEPPQEDIRNALMLLTDYGEGVSTQDVDAVRALLQCAIRKLEGK